MERLPGRAEVRRPQRALAVSPVNPAHLEGAVIIVLCTYKLPLFI